MKFCTTCGTQLHDDDNFCTKCGNHTPLPELQKNIINQMNHKEELVEHISEQEIDSNSSYSNVKLKIKTWRINIKAYMCPIIFGIFLILVGLFIQIPGGALTTYEYLDGDKTDFYVFDDKYSSIDEYVGGDAYNFIIGASLVAGKISGTMTTKTIFIVSGILCLCLGITLKMLANEKKTLAKETDN